MVGILFFKGSKQLRIEKNILFNAWSTGNLLSELWLFFIIFVNSPYKIELWEAYLTLFFYIFYILISDVICKCLTPCKDFVLKKTCSNTLLYDKFHCDLESNLNKFNKLKF